MKKNITKELIVKTALDLMRNKNDLQGLNLREIARSLGCAHTNLYNYFSSYNDLLWETHSAIQEIFMEFLIQKLNLATTAELKFSCFFEAFVDMYIDNKGWFKLAWHESIEGERPQRNIKVTTETNEMLNTYISNIWNGLTGEYPNLKKTHRVLHNTHCYIIGEVSNYLMGRGLIENEKDLKTYISHEAIRIFKLCLPSDL